MKYNKFFFKSPNDSIKSEFLKNELVIFGVRGIVDAQYTLKSSLNILNKEDEKSIPEAIYKSLEFALRSSWHNFHAVIGNYYNELQISEEEIKSLFESDNDFNLYLDFCRDHEKWFLENESRLKEQCKTRDISQ